MTDPFPALSAVEVMAAVTARWDLAGVLPVPRGEWLACPVCRAGRPQPRYWRWHRRSGTPTIPGRCDVSFKCVDCSAVWTHGVPIDADTFERRATKVNRQIWWREARTLMDREA